MKNLGQLSISDLLSSSLNLQLPESPEATLRSILKSKAQPPSEAHLAFRTITTLLASLPKDGEMKIDSSGPKQDRETRRELKLLVALSTVLVRNNEVVTVVSLRSGALDPTQHNLDLACTRIPEASANESKNRWPLFTTANHRRDLHPSNGSLGAASPGTAAAAKITQITQWTKERRLRLDPALRDAHVRWDACVQFEALGHNFFNLLLGATNRLTTTSASYPP